ncbi:signal peptidase II [Eubacterium oxidoreducens]|uniref:Lipoprotein signal peptidase n=1 Tax=Eubacterium oxidoreducens TaxID=1732 RepID=A0A1G6ALL0_EUBOX|nr:signal peptidase II [Eubacterium oxidoreducens]SDB09296.1 signal peptidase II [Eubacterium oxidoreducens]
MKKNKLIGYICIIILLVLDQVTKYAAVTHLKNQDAYVIIKNVFELNYLENHGAAFGILQEKQFFFYLITIVIVAVVVMIYRKIPSNKRFFLLNSICVLIVAGALGNFIDRIRQQYVVDFFYFKVINFPVFNVADIYVTAGAIALIVSLLFIYKDKDFNLIFKKRKQNGEAGS